MEVISDRLVELVESLVGEDEAGQLRLARLVFSDLERSNTTLKERVIDLEGNAEATQRKTRIKELEKSLQAMESLLTSYKRSIDEFGIENGKLARKLSSTQAELIAKAERVESLSTMYETVSLSEKEMNEHIRTLTIELGETKKLKEKLSNRNQQSIAKINTLNEELKVATSGREKLVSQLVTEQVEKISSPLKAKIACLEAQLTHERNRAESSDRLLTQVTNSVDKDIEMFKHKIAEHEEAIGLVSKLAIEDLENQKRVYRVSFMNEMLGSFTLTPQNSLNGRLMLNTIYPVGMLVELGHDQDSINEEDYPYPVYIYRDENGRCQTVSVNNKGKIIVFGEKRRLPTLIAEEEAVKKIITQVSALDMSEALTNKINKIHLETKYTYFSDSAQKSIENAHRVTQALELVKSEHKNRISTLSRQMSQAIKAIKEGRIKSKRLASNKALTDILRITATQNQQAKVTGKPAKRKKHRSKNKNKKR